MKLRHVLSIFAALALFASAATRPGTAAGVSPFNFEIHVDLNKAFDQFAGGLRGFVIFIREHNDMKTRAALPRLITDLNQLIADKSTLVGTLSVVAMEPGKPRTEDAPTVVHETETVMDELGKVHRDMLAANPQYAGSTAQAGLDELYSSKSKGMTELRQHARDFLTDKHELNRWIVMLKRWIQQERAGVRELRVLASPAPTHS